MGIDFNLGKPIPEADRVYDEDGYAEEWDVRGGGYEERAHWSYGGFHHFRQRVAFAVGVDLPRMEGFADEGAGIPWSDVWGPGVDLVPLLSHSDCDGEMSPEECRTVAGPLRKVVEAWSDDVADIGSGAYDKRMGLVLAGMMEAAARDNLTLLFR